MASSIAQTAISAPKATPRCAPYAADDVKIFTSIRCDPILTSSEENSDLCNRRKCKFYMPELHRQRLWKAAAKFWPSMKFAELESATSFETALTLALDERERLHETYMCPMKIKYTFMASGRTFLEISPIPALPMEALFPSTFRLPSSRELSSQSSGRYAHHRPPPTRFQSLPYLPTNSMYSDVPPPSRASSHDSRSSSSDSSSCSSSSKRAKTNLPASWEIFIDTAATSQFIHTSFKTTHRPHYTAARSRALPQPNDMTQEVLLWNPQGFITEGSFTTPYFYRKGRWVTPAVESRIVNEQDQVQSKRIHGGQQGTTRRWAMWKGLAEEGQIEARSIRDGEKVWLSNGVRGFGWGRVKLARRIER